MNSLTDCVLFILHSKISEIERLAGQGGMLGMVAHARLRDDAEWKELAAVTLRQASVPLPPLDIAQRGRGHRRG